MEKSLLLSLLLISTSSFAKSAQTKVIYGDDNRADVNDSTNPMYLRLAESTAAMISNHKIKELNNMQVELVGRTLQQNGMCETERFSQQLAVGNCSGFLVAPNKLVTAGHCIRSQSDCSNSSWVFDYKADYPTQKEFILDKTSVYKCVSIVSQKLDSTNENDYALIELDREVVGRQPLKFRTAGKPKVGDPLVVIGHPSGLPTKITDGANVRKINDVYLTANLDTYGGNSGSAVFNSDTGIIEGILVRGEQDYVYNSDKGCSESNVVGNNSGRGEDVTLIAMVEGLEVQPEQPSEPEQPEQPSEPEQPEQPSEPEQPEQPSEPEQPEQPAPPAAEPDEEPLSFWDRLVRWLLGR